MFRRLHEGGAPVTLVVDGKRVPAAPGDTVASALLVAGITILRKTAVSGSPRSVYCGMGVCFECLVEIDGEGNRQACLTAVRDGMVVTTGGTRRNLLAEPM